MYSDKKSFIKMKYGYDFYRNPDLVPIKDLAEILGIEVVNGKMRCPCPNHADNNPSVDISETGKYQNKWKCWSCGESGDALSLVLAYKEGITPSEYWNVMGNKGYITDEEKKRVYEATDNAKLFIEKHFPGNIEVINVGEQKISYNEILKPNLPKWIWEEINLKRNFEAPQYVRAQTGVDKKGKPVYKNEYFGQLSEIEAAEMIIDKLFELQINLREFQEKVFKEFPDLENNALAYLHISDVTATKTEEIDGYIEKYKTYLYYLAGKDTTDKILHPENHFPECLSVESDKEDVILE